MAACPGASGNPVWSCVSIMILYAGPAYIGGRKKRMNLRHKLELNADQYVRFHKNWLPVNSLKACAGTSLSELACVLSLDGLPLLTLTETPPILPVNNRQI